MLIVFEFAFRVLDFSFPFYPIIIDGLWELPQSFVKREDRIYNPDFRWEKEGAARLRALEHFPSLGLSCLRAGNMAAAASGTGLEVMVEGSDAYRAVLGITSSQDVKLAESCFCLRNCNNWACFLDSHNFSLTVYVKAKHVFQWD